MSADNKFKNAEKKPVTELERGDVIVYMPVKSTDWERGIVYDTILRNDGSDHPSGFIILPIETISKNINPVRPYPVVEKDNKRIVEEAGGTPGMHKTITQLHLKTVVNVTLMTGSKTSNDIGVIGSYAGSPFLGELMTGIEQLYKQGSLRKDGKLVEPTTRIRIVPKWVADQAAIENSSLRRAAYQGLENEGEKTGTSVGPIMEQSLATKRQEEENVRKAAEEKRSEEAAAEAKRKKDERARKTAETKLNKQEEAKKTVAGMALNDAVESGKISQRTLNFLKDAIVPSTGKAPKTLSHAFELVQNPDSLKAVYGLGKGGKIYQDIVSEVSTATAILKPKTP